MNVVIYINRTYKQTQFREKCVELLLQKIRETISLIRSESTKQMEEKLNFQVPAEGRELVILLHTQY